MENYYIVRERGLQELTGLASGERMTKSDLPECGEETKKSGFTGVGEIFLLVLQYLATSLYCRRGL